MKVGDVTGVLRTQRGYQILKLETRTDSKVKTFEEARGDIANRIGDQKLRGEREKYLDRLREQATITWRNTELKKAYETALPAAIRPRQRTRRPQRRIEDQVCRADSLMAESWFALWTRSRHEQVVREQLDQKHIEAFLPTVTRWSRWKDRKKKIDWPLFPGYCFARFDPRERLPVLEMHRRREHHFIRGRAGADSQSVKSTASGVSSRAISRTIRAR